MKFICEHANLDDNENRIYTLSSNDKVDYIVSIINRCGYSVEMISPTKTHNKKGFYKKRVDEIRNDFSIISGPIFGTKTRTGYKLQKLFSLIWLFFYLLKNCKKNEIVFAYHSVDKALFVSLAKKIKKFKLVLEVEELFFGLSNVGALRKKIEMKYINCANAYICASNEIEIQINKNKKPFSIANGAYIVQNNNVNARNGKKIVYAGLIVSDGAASKSIKVSRYLDSSYTIYIIGYGNQKNIEELKIEIEKENEKNECKVYYEGTKRGNEYIDFLNNCDIGLCPLPVDNKYQLSCFPSKITSYISNGLSVVTTRNPVLVNSDYHDLLFFVDNDNPSDYASVIKSLNNKERKDNNSIIKELDKKLKESFEIMLKEIK